MNRQSNTASFLFNIYTVKSWFLFAQILFYFFFLKIEFQNSIQDWLFLSCSRAKKSA